MFKKKKDPASLIEDAEDEKKSEKPRKKRPKKKCENCRRCWGFFDFLKTCWKLFKEFSANTSIHGPTIFFRDYCCLTIILLLGIKYITDSNRHWSEKLLWFIILSLSISCCFLLIFKTYSKWQDNPVVSLVIWIHKT